MNTTSNIPSKLGVRTIGIILFILSFLFITAVDSLSNFEIVAYASILGFSWYKMSRLFESIKKEYGQDYADNFFFGKKVANDPNV